LAGRRQEIYKPVKPPWLSSVTLPERAPL
jgi:hypothetical protein